MTGEGEPPVGAGEGAPPDGASEGQPDPSADAASKVVQPEDDSASTGDVDVACPDAESGASTAGETGISTILQIYEAEEDLVNVNFEIQLSVSDDSSSKKTAATASESGEEDKENEEATEAKEDKANEAAEEATDAEDTIVPEEGKAGEDKENDEKEENEIEERAKKIEEKLAPPPGPSLPAGRGRSFSLGRTRSLSVLRRKHDENRARKKKAGAASSKGKKPPKSPKAKKPADKKPSDKATAPAANEDRAPAEKPPLMPGKSMDTQKVSNVGKDQDAFWDDASRSSKNSKVLLGDGELVPTERMSRLGKSIKNMRSRSMSRKKARETRASSKKKKAQTKTPKKQPQKMRGRSKAARDKEDRQQPKQEEAEKEEEVKEEGSPRKFDKRPGSPGAFELLGASPSEDDVTNGATQEETAPKKSRPKRRYIPLRFRRKNKAKEAEAAAEAEATLNAEAELDRALDEEFAKDPGWEKGAFEGAVWLHSMDDAPNAAENEPGSKRDGSKRDGSKRDGRRGKSSDRHADRGDYDLRTKSTNGDHSFWSSVGSMDDSRAVTTWTDATSVDEATFDDQTTAFLLKDEAAAGFEVAGRLLGFRDGLGIAGLCRHPGDCRVLRI